MAAPFEALRLHHTSQGRPLLVESLVATDEPQAVGLPLVHRPDLGLVLHSYCSFPKSDGLELFRYKYHYQEQNDSLLKLIGMNNSVPALEARFGARH